MADYPVGPGQTYATPHAAWSAMEGDAVAFPSGGNTMTLFAHTITSMLDLTTKNPIMTAANRLTIRVNGTDTVTWNEGTDIRCIRETGGSDNYVTVDEGSGTLNIQGGAAGTQTIQIGWPREFYIDCTGIAGPSGGGDALYVNGGSETYTTDVRVDNVAFTGSARGFYVRMDAVDFGMTGYFRSCSFTGLGNSAIGFRTIPKTFEIDACIHTGQTVGAFIRLFNNDNGTGDLSVHHCVGYSNSAGGSWFLHGFGQASARENVSIYGNLWYANPNMGFIGDEANLGDCRYEIYNNTLDSENNGDIVILLTGSVATSHYNLTNNIFYDSNNASGAIQEHGSYVGTSTLDDNCWYSNTSDVGAGISKGAGAVNANPLFVSEVGDDYTLQATSPCIDAGTDLGLGDDIGYWQLPSATHRTQMTPNVDYW